MLRNLTLLAVLSGIGGSVLATTPPAPANAAAALDPQARALWAVQDRLVQAELAGDEAALRTILDERFMFLGSTRNPQDKEQFIALIKRSHITAIETGERKLLLDHDTAVTVETETVRGRDGRTSGYQSVTTYVRRHGQWRALASHIQKVPVIARDVSTPAAPLAQ